MRVSCTATQSAFRTHFYCLLAYMCTAEARKLGGGGGLWMLIGFLHQLGQLLGMQPVQLHRDPGSEGCQAWFNALLSWS